MAYGVPFASPPSRQSVAALLQRLSAAGQKVPGMATGGGMNQQQQKPAAPVYTAPQNPSVATPYTGDIDTYGEGPEHDFFVTPSPPPPPPPPAGGGGSGGGGGGGGGNQGGGNFNYGGGGQGTGQGVGPVLAKYPAIGQPGNPSAAQKDAAFDPYYDQHDQRNMVAPVSVPQGIAAWQGKQGPLATAVAAQNKTPAPSLGADLAPGGAGLSAYLKNLQGYNSSSGNQPGAQRWARGGPVGLATGGQPPDPSAVVAAPMQNVQNIQGQRGDQSAGLSARDQANADAAVNPSLKNSVTIGSMVAGLAGAAPLTGMALAGLKLAGQGLLTGTSPFDTPGPRVSPDQQQAAIDASAAAPGALTNQRNAYNTSISGARSMDRQAMNQQNNTPLGGYGETVDNSITANFSSPAFAHGFQAGAAAASGGGGGGAAGGGGGGAAGGGGGAGGGGNYGGGGLGGGPGAQGAGRDPGGPPGSFQRGGGVRNYAKGGMPRFPSIRRFDQGGGTSPAQQKAQAQAQADAQYASPDTEEYLADPAGAYAAMMAATARGAPAPLPMTAVGYRHSHARGGRIQRFDDGGYVTDAADNQTVDSIDPGTTDATATSSGGGGINSAWLPLMTGAFNMAQGDPYAGAASIGVATQMMGGTPQDAMDAAKLLYKSGASAQPKAQQKNFDSGRSTTNSLLAALAQQAGAANQLRMAQLDPTASMGAAPQPYQKPTVRGSTVSKATGGYVQGGEPHGVKSDGTSFAVKGPGSGQSDDINAKLSNDEHVWDATTVAALGDGSSDEGHRRLDQMREMIRAKAGLKNPKKIMGKQPGVSQILARVAGGRV